MKVDVINFTGAERVPGLQRIIYHLVLQVYVAEADGIPEYGSAASLGKRLVAVKFLLHDACEREK